MLTAAGGQFGWLAAAPAGGGRGDLLSSAFVAIGVMILVWFLLRMQWRRQARGRRDEPAAASAGRPMASLEHMEALAATGRRPDRAEEAAGAELVQLARRVLAQIEARSAQLEALIDDADARIEELRRLQASGQSIGETGGGERNGRRPPHPPHPPRPPRPPLDAHNSHSPDGDEADGAPEDPVMRGVYELADRGLAPVEIARELDQHLGAVELILALRPK